MKQIYRTARLYLSLNKDSITLLESVFESGCPEKAPLLEELHVHSDSPSSLCLGLAIEPPRPRCLSLTGVSFDGGPV